MAKQAKLEYGSLALEEVRNIPLYYASRAHFMSFAKDTYLLDTVQMPDLEASELSEDVSTQD